ncbi:MAG TPA: outer membrane lipoprotein carrier protein LolA [Bryobacteraceae bacterium]|nr:outer membrane lipoprotein carrier protein LolA [Bryobacteraceae bacterium]
MADPTFVALIKRTGPLVRLLDVLCAISLLSMMAPLLAAADSPDPLVHRVEQRYNAAHTLSVHFVEHYKSEGHGRRPEEGTLTLRKVGKMRWDYSEPKGKLFISDGKNLYLYTAADNRVERWKLKETEDMRAPLAFLLGHMDMQKEFHDFSTHPGLGGTWLDATAKNAHAPYESVEMLIMPDDSIRQLNVKGRDGSELSYDFDQEKLNVPVSDRMFDFAIPPGAQVVNSVGLNGQGG